MTEVLKSDFASGDPPSSGPLTNRDVTEHAEGSGIFVTYTYKPRWTASRQLVLGQLARDRQEALIIAREAFEEMGRYPDDRITFHAGYNTGLNVRLMDNAWGYLLKSHPIYIEIQTKSGPKGASSKGVNQVLATACVIIVLVLILVAIS